MSFTHADVVDRARKLWPLITIAAAPDAFALCWVPTALLIAGPAYNERHLDAAAHALAHFLYSEPSTGLGTGAAGPVTSVKTKSLSVTYGNTSSGASGGSADLSSTAPGRVLLTMRAALAATVPFMVL